ncbi:MAG: response regulator [Gemmatimonadetes bacterium]|nr:response regulator [Gemmatimonadota bacterium]
MSRISRLLSRLSSAFVGAGPAAVSPSPQGGLPGTDASRNGGAFPGEASSRRERTPGRRNALLVEDNADTLEAMRVLLDSWGFRVTLASSVPEALDAMRHAVPEVVISDIGMPHVDGLSFARAVRGSEQDAGANRVLLVAITGYASRADRDRALAAGFDAYLTKPIDFLSLQRLLDRHRPHGDPNR